MNELRDLYREVILDHNRSPRNFGEIDGADRVVEGVNPLCGDRLTLYLKLDENRIDDIKFKGSGCAISMASSSLMTERVKGATVEESLSLFEKVHEMLAGQGNAIDELDKLAALSGVREFPTRVKCASLAWHALKSALSGTDDRVSTE
ncbi:MAG: SUF system NifU family Fe-S cluster assembly protein [Gammaproteobacteria bacterium]|nr:SUF system NifU family Fe-S cluster assembly protein [Gammaproteobacteria bacterium]